MCKTFSVLLLFLVGTLAGCASVPHRVDVMYLPSATAKGGGGKLYLSEPRVFCSSTPPSVRWVLGQIREKDGTFVDEIISPMSPRDQVNDALRLELEKSGYEVSLGDAGPDAVSGPYLRLSDVKVDLSAVPAWFKVTSTARVSLQLELWGSGRLLKKERYESGYQESYARTQSEEIQIVLQKALEGVTDKAVPDIVRAVGAATGEGSSRQSQ